MIVPGFAVKGLGALEAALTRGEAQVELAARANVQLASLELIKQAQANFSGSHRKHQRHIPNANNYPNVVTGTLRRSIQSDGLRSVAPGVVSTKVGPTTVYGRAIELGNPHSRSGAYPYFGPAVKRVRAKTAGLATANWAKFIRF
jgi:hypothetical protein